MMVSRKRHPVLNVRRAVMPLRQGTCRSLFLDSAKEWKNRWALIQRSASPLMR